MSKPQESDLEDELKPSGKTGNITRGRKEALR